VIWARSVAVMSLGFMVISFQGSSISEFIGESGEKPSQVYSF